MRFEGDSPLFRRVCNLHREIVSPACCSRRICLCVKPPTRIKRWVLGFTAYSVDSDIGVGCVQLKTNVHCSIVLPKKIIKYL